MAQSQIERRKIQRDWFGHGVQLFGMILLLGLPMLYWGIGINTTTAAMTVRIDRQEKDIDRQGQMQLSVTGQLIDVNKQLTKIDTLLGEFRDELKAKRR
jgi:hypothetical protein